MANKTIKKLGNALFLALSKLYYRAILLKDNSELVIFDIDNTVANSWVTFQEGHPSEADRLQSIKPFANMVGLVNDYHARGIRIVFLSARPYSSYSLTHKWLTDYNFRFDYLFLVPKAKDKLFFLRSLGSRRTTYYDDLSYHHEHGEIKYYSAVINSVKQMHNIKYFGYEDILRLQRHEK